MNTFELLVGVAFAIYVVGIFAFIVLQNRAPSSTLAWMLAFFFLPGLGVLVYFLFARGRKTFSRRSKLLKHELRESAMPLLSPLLSREEAEIRWLESRSETWRRLMTLVRRNSTSALSCRNKVEIQQDAAVFYPSLVRDLQAARSSIHLQYFIWAADSFTGTLKELLVAKVAEGVDVRLLYDPIGSQASVGPRYLRAMRAAGIRMVPTSPLSQLHTLAYRNHRKITVVDGSIGYTGGMNIGQEHLDGGDGFTSWRDTQLRIVGDAAVLLEAVFMVDWFNATGEDLFSTARGGDAAARVTGDVPVQILTSGPDSRWAAIRQLYGSMIVSAQRRVFLQSPFFLPDATVAEALRAAALSGVDVRVMVSARPSGNRLPDWAGNTFIADIVASGVRVFLYRKGYLHAKTISIDSEVCSVGSANLDLRSFSINYELNAVLYDADLARRLESDFERDLLECIEFDPAGYRQSPLPLRLRDSLARLVSPLL